MRRALYDIFGPEVQEAANKELSHLLEKVFAPEESDAAVVSLCLLRAAIVLLKQGEFPEGEVTRLVGDIYRATLVNDEGGDDTVVSCEPLSEATSKPPAPPAEPPPLGEGVHLHAAIRLDRPHATPTEVAMAKDLERAVPMASKLLHGFTNTHEGRVALLVALVSLMKAQGLDSERACGVFMGCWSAIEVMKMPLGEA